MLYKPVRCVIVERDCIPRGWWNRRSREHGWQSGHEETGSEGQEGCRPRQPQARGRNGKRFVFYYAKPYLLYIFGFYARKQLLFSPRLSHRNSVCPFVCLSVTRVDQSKAVQAMIIRSLPSAAWKTLVSGNVKLFHKFEEGHPERGRWMRGGEKNLRFLANRSLYLNNGAR